MAELWPLQVAGEGEDARSEIFAFCGLFFFEGGVLRDASLKGIRYFNCLFPRGREEKRNPPVSYLLKKVWRCSLFK